LFSGPNCPGTPGAATCPEPLCMIEVFPRSSWSPRTTSAGVTPPSLLVRAHAAGRPPPLAYGLPLDNGSGQVAVSPCWEEDLPDVLSAHLSLRAWPPPPAAREVPLPVSSPTTAAVPPCGPGRRSTMPGQRLPYGALGEAAVRRCCAGRRCARHPDRSSRYGLHRRAAVTFPSEPLTGCSLPVPRICAPSASGP
jgi:hypothetical protein